jgi:signal transduction histidine kinase
MAKSMIAGLPVADAELKECIQLASSEVERLTSLLNDYRSFARPQHLKIERTDVHKLLDEVLALHFKRYASLEISIKLDIPDQLPKVSLDAAKIKQAILNLCQNAVDAMPNGGTLLVRAYCTQANLVIEIADTGSGIPEGLDVFQLFKTTKRESTGLGLPIVQHIVSEHNGSVDYVTDPGRGTTFRMILPADKTNTA